MEKRRERIIEMIKVEGLSQAEFARKADLNTSTLSHVLTGRNKPSEGVLRKILNGFPRYSALWLLEGDGEMFASEFSTHPTTLQSIHQQTLLGTDRTIHTMQDPLPLIPLQIPQNQQDKPLGTSLFPTMKEEVSRKKVTKIILYYDDNTFQTFTPENET